MQRALCILAGGGDTALALTDLNHALASRPDYTEALFVRGTLLYALGQPADAKPDLARFTEIVPDHAVALRRLASVHELLGDKRPAILCALRADLADGRWPIHFKRIGVLCTVSGLALALTGVALLLSGAGAAALIPFVLGMPLALLVGAQILVSTLRVGGTVSWEFSSRVKKADVYEGLPRYLDSILRPVFKRMIADKAAGLVAETT